MVGSKPGPGTTLSFDRRLRTARNNPQATGAATSAQNISNTLAGNASGLYGELAPELQTEATAPAGYGQADLSAMNTAAQQSAGGGQAGATGQGALLAGRTKNAGTADAAIQGSARTAGQQLGNEAVGIQGQNANLKQHQQQAGLSGLEGLYGENTGQAVNALGQVASNVNANTNAEDASWNWSKYLLDPLLGAAGAASGTIGKAAGVGG